MLNILETQLLRSALHMARSKVRSSVSLGCSRSKSQASRRSPPVHVPVRRRSSLASDGDPTTRKGDKPPAPKSSHAKKTPPNITGAPSVHSTLSDYETGGRNVQFASPVFMECGLDDKTAQFYSEIDNLLASGTKADYDKAYNLLKQKEQQYAAKPGFHWRYAKVLYFLSNAAGEKGAIEQKKKFMYAAKNAAQEAINLDPKCPNGHKWFAITLGCTGDYETTSEKLKNALVIKKHIQCAIELNPNDPTPHHMLGRWCYSVYMLTWIERKAAAAFFGSPPTSTIEEALIHFMQAERLNPGVWKENTLYIGKCLIEKRQYSEAVGWLRKAVAGPAEKDVDPDVQKEVRCLLGKYAR